MKNCSLVCDKRKKGRPHTFKHLKQLSIYYCTIISTLFLLTITTLVLALEDELICQLSNERPKVDCHPEADASEWKCLARGCCWHEQRANYQQAPFVGTPSCFYPANFDCYDVVFPSNHGHYSSENQAEATATTTSNENLESSSDTRNYQDYGKSHEDFLSTSREVSSEEDGGELPKLQLIPTPPSLSSNFQAKTKVEDENEDKTFLRLLLKRKESCRQSGFENDASQIQLELSIYGDSIINIKIIQPDEKRFEPSLPEIKLPERKLNHHYRSGNHDKRRDLTTTTVDEENNKNQDNNDDDGGGWKRKVLLTNHEQIFVELIRKEANEFAPSERNVLILRIINQKPRKVLFEIDLGKMIYSKRFIQLPTYLASDFIYGLGLHMGESLLKSSGNQHAKAHTMFNYGHPPQADGKTSYSSYPFYMNLIQLTSEESSQSGNENELNGNQNHLNESINVVHNNNNTVKSSILERKKFLAIGCLMLNSNAMDVLIHSNNNDEPDNNVHNNKAGITWRLVGGIVDLYLYLGPKPNDVIYQYQSLVGLPAMPPVWALGYHQSRHNYDQLMSIKMAWARTKSSGIPMESVWTDLEFLKDSSSYSLNNLELNDLVRALQETYGMHYVTIVDPSLSLNNNNINTYEALKLAKSLDLFAKYDNYQNLNGNLSSTVMAKIKSWPTGSSGLLDFTNLKIVDYLKIILKDYRKQLNFNGLWLDMNEPEVFENQLGTDESNYEKNCNQLIDERLFELAYKPGKRDLSDRTLCLSAKFAAGYHFDIHNLYAFYQSKAHYEALEEIDQNSRPFIISRGQFVGQAKYSGTWLGDLSSEFNHLRWSLIAIIESNFFGQPFVGADICGFFGNSNDELCSRWYSFASLAYPFARNHNDAKSLDQDPGSMGEIVQFSARITMLKRYSLLPYLYTLFYDNHLKGEPVIRSILFEFFDLFAYKLQNLEQLPQIDDQLMIGSSIMLAPILYPATELRNVYLPPGRWFDVSIGLPGTNTNEGLFDSLSSNWPNVNFDSIHCQSSNDNYSTEANTNELNESARIRLGRLRKPIECIKDTGCWLNRQYTPLGAINIYLKGGSIIPTFRHVNHENSVNKLWKEEAIFLEIALNTQQEAFGNLYWDNGQDQTGLKTYNKANFWASHNRLKITLVEEGNTKEQIRINGFLIYGIQSSYKQQNNTNNNTLDNNIKLSCKHETKSETLSCLFVSISNEHESKPLIVRKYETITIYW